MRVGSIVRCKEDCNFEYYVTNCDGEYMVTEITEGDITIKVVSHKRPGVVGREYTVDPKHFYEKSVKFS